MAASRSRGPLFRVGEISCDRTGNRSRKFLPAFFGVAKTVLYGIVIRMTKSSNASSILSVRVTPSERAMLEEAARDAGASLSDFVRRKSIAAAEEEILNRSTVTIPAEHWDAFEAWLHRPPEVNPGLVELLRRIPVWER